MIRKLYSLVAVLLIYSSTAFGQNIKIKGNILHSADPEVKLNIPVDGNFFEGANLETPVYPTDGSFYVEFEASRAGFLTLVNNWRSVTLFVSPGQEYTLQWDMKTREGLTITGFQAEGQMMLQGLALGQVAKRYSSLLDSVPTVKERLVLASKQANEKKEIVKDYYKRKKINIDFYQSALELIEVDRINLLSTNYFFEYRKWEKRGEEDMPKMDIFFKEFMPAWKSLYQNINASTTWLQSSAITEILSRYKFYLNLADSGRLIFEKGNFAKTNFDRIKPNLKGKMLEYAWANSIVVGINQKEYEKEWIQDFEDFKTAFPKSALIPYVEPSIQKVIDYQYQLEAKQDAEVLFVKDYEQINELDQLLASLKGKVTYIDLWATWCVPCREELKYSVAMHKTLEDLGVQPLYISLDNDKADDAWNKMVYGLGLKGLNMRVNSTFHADLNANIPNFYGIPRYLIVDKEGKVVVWNAKRPSDQLDLINQLKEYL